MKVLVSWMRELGGYVSREFHFIMRAYWSRRSIVLVVGGMGCSLPALAQAAAK
jgi:hypothetical protein